MTTTEHVATHACLRCGGSGRDPRGFTREQFAVLARLMELGDRAKDWPRRDRYTPDGRARLAAHYDTVRAEVARARALHISTGDIMVALDVSDTAYRKIITGVTGALPG